MLSADVTSDNMMGLPATNGSHINSKNKYKTLSSEEAKLWFPSSNNYIVLLKKISLRLHLRYCCNVTIFTKDFLSHELL